MNNYGTIEEEKKTAIGSFADKIESFASKAKKPDTSGD